MVKFIIARHGYSQFNKSKQFTGQYDVNLNAIGYLQAEEVGKYVLENYKVDKIYSSDLKRAIDTAKPIAEALKLPILTRKNLREMYLGEWERKSFEEVKEKYPNDYNEWVTDLGFARATGGESSKELIVRVSEEFERIAKENEGKTVFIATHGGAIRALICAWLRVPLEEMKNIQLVANGSITVIEYDNETKNAIIEKNGDSSYLTQTTGKVLLV